jgi:solute carrier family 24 (sodium/potassium/calcium exchanger), member 6
LALTPNPSPNPNPNLPQVLRLPAGLLGATLLAWGNSLSDTVSNATMARDGYPTMAITACFASPLFILLAGEGGGGSRLLARLAGGLRCNMVWM